MRVTVSGHRMDVGERLRDYAIEKAGKLQKYYDRVQSAEVVFEIEASKHLCEIIAKVDHHTAFVAKEQHDDPYASLDAAVKEVERQIRRHKEKFRNRKHAAGRAEHEPLSGSDLGEDFGTQQTEGEAS